MTVYGYPNKTIRLEELRRFMVFMLMLIAVSALFLLPSMAHAADGAQWNGQFGPDATITNNTNASLKGWWQTAASWSLWISIGCLLFSIFFLGGKWWWIPVCVFLICLFGEKTITQVGAWAGFAALT